jgi:hypothetical protein
MQTRAQSTLEVLVDFAFSMLMNIGGQLVFYHAMATAGRVTLFAALVLGLAFARRFATRRFFEALVPLGTRQAHWQSVVESIVDTGLGYGVAVALQILIYGESATLLRASGLTFVIYGLTMVRRYILRRIFAAMALRTA